MTVAYAPTAIVSADEPAFGAYAPNLAQRLMVALTRIPPFGRGIFRKRLAGAIRGLSPSGAIDVFFRGAAFRLRGASSNLIEDGILVRPGYNGREIDFLAGALGPGSVFVDLGANIGLYTLPLARNAGRAIAIDANPAILKALDFNTVASGLANVTPVCAAVGEHTARARLEIRKDDLAIVSVEEDENGEVAMRTLADILAEAGVTRIDALKADIEGYEDRAILPFLATCAPDMKPRRIVIEHLGRKEWPTDCFPVFEAHGYRLCGQTRGNSLFERDPGADASKRST
jgi:FkbM family methyltransferase